MERSDGCITKAKNQSAEQKCYICGRGEMSVNAWTIYKEIQEMELYTGSSEKKNLGDRGQNVEVGEIFHCVLFQTVWILVSFASNMVPCTNKKAFLRRTKWKKSPERKVSMLWCLNIFHMRRTAIKFSISREWADGEEKIGAPRGRTPGGWRERSHAVSGHLSGPSLGSYGEVMW